MRSPIHLLLLAGASLAVAACASQPEPEPIPPTPPPVQMVTAPPPAPPPPAPPPAPTGPAPGSKADFAAKTTSRVYFDYDQYTLDDQDRSTLQGQARWLSQFPTVRVQIEGNADERGTREYNLALGARRAEAVADYLASLGVNEARIETISYGKDRPINPGSNEEAWAQNRNANTNVVSEAGS